MFIVPQTHISSDRSTATITKKTSRPNLSKAHVTRDSSSPATLAISVGLQQ